MQRDWRTQEAKIRDRKEDEEDDLAEKREEDGLLWLGVEAAGKSGGKGKKKKKRDKEDEADPWKVLERKRREQERERADADKNNGGRGFGVGGTGQSRGLSARDTVQAPPVLKPVKNIFKVMPEGGSVGYRDPRVLERTVMS